MQGPGFEPRPPQKKKSLRWINCRIRIGCGHVVSNSTHLYSQSNSTHLCGQYVDDKKNTSMKGGSILNV